MSLTQSRPTQLLKEGSICCGCHHKTWKVVFVKHCSLLQQNTTFQFFLNTSLNCFFHIYTEDTINKLILSASTFRRHSNKLYQFSEMNYIESIHIYELFFKSVQNPFKDKEGYNLLGCSS